MTNNHRLPENLNPVGTRCVPLFLPDDPQWIAYLLNVVQSLTFDRHWERDAAHSAIDVRRLWYETTYAPLINALQSGMDCSSAGTPEAGGCIEYPPYASFIQFFPTSPYEAGAIPTGYLRRPFLLFSDYIANWLPDPIENIIQGVFSGITDYEPDDVIVDLLSYPILNFTLSTTMDNFPYMKISVQGQGQVELHLINMFFGGYAVITIDNPPSIFDVITDYVNDAVVVEDVFRDVITFPVESASTAIAEVNFEGAPDDIHDIYVTFVPAVDDSLPPVRFGGGIRKVVLCGVTPVGYTPPPPVVPPEGTVFVTLKPEFQFTVGCGLEYRLLDTTTQQVIQDWAAVAGWDANAAECFANPFPVVTANDCKLYFDMDGDGTDETVLNLALCGGDKTPPPPIKDDPLDTEANDKLCGAANYMASQISDILDIVISIDAAYQQSFDLQGALLYWQSSTKIGTDYDVLAQLLTLMFNGTDSNLTTAMDLIESDIVALLYCNGLDQSFIDNWIKTTAPITQRERDIISAVVRLLTESEWQLMAYFGATQQATTCQDCGVWCVEAYGGSGQNTWLIEPYAPVTCVGFYAADEVQSCTASGHRQWATKLSILASNTIHSVSCKIRSTNTTGDESVYCHVLDKSGAVLWSDSALIPVGSGATNDFCFSPDLTLPAGGTVVLYVYADSTNYSYANLTTAQVNGAGIAPYTPNCVSSFSCPTLINSYTHNFASNEVFDTLNLDAGKLYRIDTIGIGYYDGGGSWADAFYYDNSNNPPVSPTAYTGGGLQINGADASPYPSVNTDYNGVYSVLISGVTSIATQIVDGSYWNNGGTIDVKIYEL